MGFMAAEGFYHCAVRPVGRATGRSSVAAAAYRAGECLTDERTGLIHDYRAKSGVIDKFIVAPADAPEWASDREALWNAIEEATTAKNGRLATELELALPHELNKAQRRALAESFARDMAGRYGIAVDVAIHGPGKGGDHRNHHAHMMFTHRQITAEGVGEIANKVAIERKVNGRMKTVTIAGAFNDGDIQPTRQAWAEAVNAAYKSAGLDIRVDHRSHADRGLNAEPTQHLGPSATGLERRGEATDRGDENRGVCARNAERSKIEAERLTLAAAIADLVAERGARADAREMRAAIRTASSARILDAMTARRATFTRTELMTTLRRGVDSRDDAAIMATELLAHPDVIGLRETADATVTRYTTREVLAAERQIMKDARALAEAPCHGLSERQKNAALTSHKYLNEEQRAAFDHLTSGTRFALLAGEAGTGKSTVLAAVRDAYEAAGYRVIGMAWTNRVVQNMKADGFTDEATIAAALRRLERGKDKWDSKTVVIVDEAAMLSSATVARLQAAVLASGAILREAGDDKQLASIERGGMFGALQAEHGAAELHIVRRVQDAVQQRAFNYMHAGAFGTALAIFDKCGAIHWTDTQDEARDALVAQWAADTKAAPEKSRFVFAYSNADVDALNSDLRAIRRERGELGKDYLLQTRDGPTAFAAGDLLQFTGSAYYAGDKQAGLVAGGVGTLRGIDGARMTVELDGVGTRKGRVVSFTVGEAEEAGQFNAIRHGYAGTIYKGQGQTLDQSYLYHSQHWRAASAYVALSRHRESTALFVAREVTGGGEPWTLAGGGLEAMDDRQRQRAYRAYQTWAEEHPGPATRLGLAEFVAYVQYKQGEQGRSAHDMEQLTRQIGRADETRAASQFVASDSATVQTMESSNERPWLSGPLRLAALRRAGKEVARALADPLAELIGKVPTGRPSQALGKYDALKTEAEDGTRTPAPPASELDAAMAPDIREDVERRAEIERQRQRDKGRSL